MINVFWSDVTGQMYSLKAKYKCLAFLLFVKKLNKTSFTSFAYKCKHFCMKKDGCQHFKVKAKVILLPLDAEKHPYGFSHLFSFQKQNGSYVISFHFHWLSKKFFEPHLKPQKMA